MKFKLQIKLFLACSTFILGCSAFAQSQFTGAYGQISTGYESNQVSSVQLIGKNYGGTPNISNTDSAKTNSAPLVLGIGYVLPIQNNFTLGLGVDYSALTQETGATNFYYPAVTNSPNFSYKFTISNRYSVFVAPGYVIDRDKLAYAKLGYSSQSVQYSQTNCCSSPSNKAQVGGYVLGLGYKQFIASGLYGFVEANYYAYAKPNLSSTYTDSPGGTVSSNPSLSAYNFLLGLGYRF
ncbi:outer membrane beta-barrel protein [Polynucleobacter paneuropaeus]|nr:outer membrane beta-barrel protein [Polynucleobacter paneuropaeus]